MPEIHSRLTSQRNEMKGGMGDGHRYAFRSHSCDPEIHQVLEQWFSILMQLESPNEVFIEIC